MCLRSKEKGEMYGGTATNHNHTHNHTHNHIHIKQLKSIYGENSGNDGRRSSPFPVFKFLNPIKSKKILRDTFVSRKPG